MPGGGTCTAGPFGQAVKNGCKRKNGRAVSPSGRQATQPIGKHAQAPSLRRAFTGTDANRKGRTVCMEIMQCTLADAANGVQRPPRPRFDALCVLRTTRRAGAPFRRSLATSERSWSNPAPDNSSRSKPGLVRYQWIIWLPVLPGRRRDGGRFRPRGQASRISGSPET